MKNIFKTYWPLLVMLGVVGFLFTFRLGRDLLWDWDECIYAGYATSMKASGNLLHNTWNSLSLFEKSPFYSWILQIPLLFGRTEFLLRLPTVIASLTLLSAVYIFCQKFFSRTVAILAALILLTGEVFVIYSTKVSTDVLFSLFIFTSFWSWFSSSKQNGKYWVVSGTFFGLALMIKGLGVIPYIGTLFLTIFFNPKKSRFEDFFKMTGVFILIGLPWHLYALMTHQKEFVQMYLVDNFYKRSTFPVEFHRERLWFYIDLISKELYPWLFASIIFPLIVILNIVKDLAKRTKAKHSAVARLLTVLGVTVEQNSIIYAIFLFILIPLISISRVHTRIAWYVLPLYPFLAVYLAYNLNLVLEFVKKRNKVLRSTLYVLLLILITFDAGKLIINETRFTEAKQTRDPRYEVILQSSKQNESTLNYLVPFGERQAKVILPPEETLTNTWYYGGNACAVYYSNKQVNYFYEINMFEKALKQEKGLFLISNQDSKYAEGKKIYFKNSEFTLFTF